MSDPSTTPSVPMPNPPVPNPPTPNPDARSQPWFDAAREGRLLLQRCDHCGAYRFPLWARCDQCWSTDWSWADSAGRGTLYSFARMHRVYHPGFEAEVPYTIAVVELEEGPRVETRLVNTGDATPRCGMAVAVVFQPIPETDADAVHVPFFQLV